MKQIFARLALVAFFWAVCLGGYLLIMWLFHEGKMTSAEWSYGIMSTLAIAIAIGWTAKRREEENK